ncbi:MAG: DRTGG domain-containing protein [Verrucomicrobiae bacterium]|nr:DRTGG domain-containing protein [Verrucomicrobiae bacterium]
MKVQQVLELLAAELLAGDADGDVHGCYVGDLLSDVLASAKPHVLWITVQVHRNVVSVASMKDIPVVLITRGRKLDPQTVAEAEEAGLTVLSTPLTSYEAAGRLWEAGLR